MEKKKLNVFQAFDRGVQMLENFILGTTFGSIIVLTSVQVFYRYVLRTGLMWAAEIQAVLMVAMAMFGCAKATREKGHTELTAVTGLLPRKGRIGIRAVTTIAALIFIAVFLFAGIQYTASAGKLKSIMLNVPFKYFYSFLPIGTLFNIYEFIKLIPSRIMQDPPSDY